MIAMIPANYLSGVETIGAVRSGERTVAQVIKDHEVRYVANQDTLKAWAAVGHKKAIDELEESGGDRPLTGMVIGVKDIICRSESRRAS